MNRLFTALLVALLLVCAVSAQVAVAPILLAKPQFFTKSGSVCSGCKILTYAGGTTNPLATYVDSTGTVTNPTTITLDSAGYPPNQIQLGPYVYKIVLQDALSVPIWTVDNVSSTTLVTSGLASIAGNNTFSGLNTDSMQHTFSAGITGSGSTGALTPGSGILGNINSFTALQTFKNANGVRNAAAFAGVDIGAQVNAAIADFGVAPACGSIYIPRGDYSFSTTIDFGGRDGCYLSGAGRGGLQGTIETGTATNLTYTSSAKAIINSAANYKWKLSDFTLHNSGTGTVGIEDVNGFYSSLRDLSVNGFATNIKLNGGGAFGLNVAVLDNVDSQNASVNALWMTGTGCVSCGVYNVQVIGGHYNCSTLTASTSILIDSKSANNQIWAPLLNGCGTGIHDVGEGFNIFRDVSIQGATVGFQIDSTADSDTIEAPYLFSNGTNLIDNSTNSTYVNIAANTPSKGNRMSSYLQVAPFNGGTHPQQMWADTDAAGSSRFRLESWSGVGTAYFPYYQRNNGGTLEFVRCDVGTPALPTADGANCAVAFSLSNAKVATFNGAVTFTQPMTGTTLTLTGGTAPVVGSPTVGQVTCVKSAGPPVVIGACSGAVSGTSSCTCN